VRLAHLGWRRPLLPTLLGRVVDLLELTRQERRNKGVGVDMVNGQGAR
jgi:hypothetical protein